MVIVGRGNLVCTADYSWHEDVFFPQTDQPLATEAATADAAAVTTIRSRDVLFKMTKIPGASMSLTRH